jgi:hypothetical protein
MSGNHKSSSREGNSPAGRLMALYPFTSSCRPPSSLGSRRLEIMPWKVTGRQIRPKLPGCSLRRQMGLR